jgi:hypothetical protein
MKKLFDSAKKFLFENDFDHYKDYLELRRFLYELIMDFKREIQKQHVPVNEIAKIDVILKEFDSYAESIIKHAPDDENDLENYLVDRLKRLYGVERFDINFEIKK